jgi:DinB superfamily
MTSRLLLSLSRLERRTRSLLDELCTWTPEQLRFRPFPASWSALELIEHLMLAERAVLQMMRGCMGEAHEVIMSDRFRSAMVLGMMALPLRLKVPHAVNQLTPSKMPPDLMSLCDSWSEDRRVLAEFLAGLSVVDRKLGVFRHPAGGWTTAGGALLFLRLHLWHHSYQFRRLRQNRPCATTGTGVRVFERKTLN